MTAVMIRRALDTRQRDVFGVVYFATDGMSMYCQNTLPAALCKSALYQGRPTRECYLVPYVGNPEETEHGRRRKFTGRPVGVPKRSPAERPIRVWIGSTASRDAAAAMVAPPRRGAVVWASSWRWKRFKAIMALACGAIVSRDR